MGARLELHHDRTPGGYDQISLQVVQDTTGIGYGYRLLGPKHIGNSVPVARHPLSQRDAEEIRTMLDEVFPPGRPTACGHGRDVRSTLPDGRIGCTSCDLTIGDQHDPVADAGLAANAGLRLPVGAGAMPVFTIKAKDALALSAVAAYRNLCTEQCLHGQASEVQLAYNEIELWQQDHEDQVRLPNHQHVPAGG